MTNENEPLDLMSDYVEVQRTDHTGTIWFAAALGAVALVVASIVLSGWRPSDLGSPAAEVWWTGFAFAFVGLAGIGYAGCPIYWGNVSVAHRQKSIAIRGGLVFFLLGAGLTTLALLLG